MIKLLALDLDGTTLNSQGEIPDANRKAIRAAEERGVLVTIATGRRFRDAQPVGIDLRSECSADHPQRGIDQICGVGRNALIVPAFDRDESWRSFALAKTLAATHWSAPIRTGMARCFTTGFLTIICRSRNICVGPRPSTGASRTGGR
ncbi:MAG: HAD hydrolase family protein [Chloracidobacterium sp.]|nr:HAD hydrolase family protein [Chloracidobacterium sp.]